MIGSLRIGIFLSLFGRGLIIWNNQHLLMIFVIYPHTILALEDTLDTI